MRFEPPQELDISRQRAGRADLGVYARISDSELSDRWVCLPTRTLSDLFSSGISSVSVMQRIEQGFYGLTRLLSILLTLALLACAAAIAERWLDATAPETRSVANTTIPAVATENVIASVAGGNEDSAESDANREARERMQKAILSFASKYNVPADHIEPGNYIGDVLTTAADQQNEQLSAAYANGVASMLEHALTDPRIDGLIRKAEGVAKPPNAAEKLGVDLDAIDSTLTNLVTQYESDFQQKLVPKEASDFDQLKKRDDTIRAMARMGGPLFLLLLILQVLAFGRVDQSLRDIAHKQNG